MNGGILFYFFYFYFFININGVCKIGFDCDTKSNCHEGTELEAEIKPY